VRGASASAADRARHRAIVEAFLAASKAGDFEALVSILDPDVVMRTDAQGVRMGGPAELRGAANVAAIFNGRARAALPGLVDGGVGVIVPIKGRMLLVFDLRFHDGRISAIDVVADRDALAALEVQSIEGGDALAGSPRPA
jgi:RNA polymerase sigma-70 factor (ECF subfamily)